MMERNFEGWNFLIGTEYLELNFNIILLKLNT
jgi:hypothetical protein